MAGPSHGRVKSWQGQVMAGSSHGRARSGQGQVMAGSSHGRAKSWQGQVMAGPSQGRDQKKSQCCVMCRSRKQCQCSAKQEGAMRALVDDGKRWPKFCPWFLSSCVVSIWRHSIPPDKSYLPPPPPPPWACVSLLRFLHLSSNSA